MKSKKFATALLLLAMLTAAVQTVSAQGCRRGTPRSVVMRRAAGGQQRHPGGDFYKGDRHQLVVMAEFADYAFQGDETATLQQWDKIFNTQGLNEAPFMGSVHDYFYDQSNGQFRVTFDLHYVKLPGNREKYRSTSANDENSQYLVIDIMDQLELRTIDWSLYDWNGDGFVNQLLIIFAGKGSGYGGFGGGEDAIWPHQWWLSEHRIDGTSSEYCTPRKVTDANGKTWTVDCYCALQELSKNNTYGSFGTLCHEYTHCFGMPDFYNGSTKYVGAWDLMDYGNNNNSGFCPPNYSGHERWLMGWLTPTELTTATTVSNMAALGDKQQAYLIRNDGYENEYYIVENRQRSGWDTYIPGSGIVVFHIDYDADMWASTKIMTNSYNSEHYTIIPANNDRKISAASGWAYPYEENSKLTNMSTPVDTLYHKNADGTYHMNKPLTNMRVADGLASFDFMKAPSAVQAVNSALVLKETWFDLQGRQLSGRPQRKGLYIVNGRKVIIR